MKKRTTTVILCAALICILCVSAYALDSVDKGIGPITNHITGITVTADTGSSGTIDGVNVVDAEKLFLSYPDAEAGANYMVFLLKGETGAPTDANIAYIFQKTADANGVSFTIFPNSMSKGSYRVILTSATDPSVDFNTPVATFSYYQRYKLGDVDDSGGITAYDASLVLQYCVADAADKPGIIPVSLQPAADVDVSGGITAYDASIILQYCVADDADKPGIIPG